jgi:hypothetical protein
MQIWMASVIHSLGASRCGRSRLWIHEFFVADRFVPYELVHTYENFGIHHYAYARAANQIKFGTAKPNYRLQAQGARVGATKPQTIYWTKIQKSRLSKLCWAWRQLKIDRCPLDLVAIIPK